ncbi:MAG: NAD-dependent epimerase/dehydratase family protein [Prevotellaceae bacterium]|jgi:nucleoside-diphosphate-sugar epimerase|nr:NAD-dependent epimerase/dehydratase family protein [Prevotellaceae bacterium]
MKLLFIGGTGTISTAVSAAALAAGHELYLINRGNRNSRVPEGAVSLTADINSEQQVAALIDGLEFDAVADFIAFVPAHLERDYRLFRGRTRQFIFISSASTCRKPPADYRISEATPLANPYSQYARDKIACEEYLLSLYRRGLFPATIVRPSHTYCELAAPVAVRGANGSWQVLQRMLERKPVIIHGDGTSLWTMTHSRDFAQAFIGLTGNIHAIGETVQITSDEVLTWNQIYECTAQALHVPLNALHVPSELLAACSPYDYTANLLGDKAHSLVFDNTKLKRMVPGFTATVRFDRGIRETVDYILSHKECRPADEAFDAWCDRVVSVMQHAAGVLNPNAL